MFKEGKEKPNVTISMTAELILVIGNMGFAS